MKNGLGYKEIKIMMGKLFSNWFGKEEKKRKK